jgi:hypothetical protein
MSYTYQITHIRLITVPNFDPSITGGGCDPYVMIKMLIPISNSSMASKNQTHEYKARTIFNQSKAQSKIKKCYPHEKFVDLDISEFNVRIKGDVNIVLWDQDKYSSDDIMCNFWINTAFIEKNYLVFDKSVIDRAHKDKFHRAFDADFKVEVYLHRVQDEEIVFNADDGDEPAEQQQEDDEDDDDA